MRLDTYLYSSFWRFNVDFCIQYVHVDYHKMMLIQDESDANDAFDLDSTTKIIETHMAALAELNYIKEQHKLSNHAGEVVQLEAKFFRIYNSIMKRLVLQSTNIDYLDAPTHHKEIGSYQEFLIAYAQSVAYLSEVHLESMVQQIEKLDKANARQAKKVNSKNKQKSKIVNIKDLALDRFSRSKYNGD